MSTSDSDIKTALVAQLGSRSADASICPSEVARALASEDYEWRALMPRVRQVAAHLVDSEQVIITRGDTALSTQELDGGPIRIRRGKRFPSQQSKLKPEQKP